MKKGSITVHTENIFPIIKKWLYSEKDIFLRELISNGCDAVNKLKKIAASGELSMDKDEPFRIVVILDKENKTLTISDNGIGMTGEEIEKYITQVAFSGAEEFLEKYKDEKDDKTQIIGHFGLGFYSAFMVADTVDIDSRSYHSEQAAFWSSDGGTEYELGEGKRTQRGTSIVLHVSEENSEFLEDARISGILNKYCAFLPVEIYFQVEGKDKPEKPINETNPLWLKKPSDCTEDEYKDFYSKVFMDFNPPLFWIHLNVDYPFNLKGILYFPKLNNKFETAEGQIKLFNNQVFVADNIKEVIPEFLLLLKGAIDCPDLPLNVSRSFLQNDGYVQKVSAHITRKIADKLTSLFTDEREAFEGYWEDINPFIKYGCLREEKFYDRVKDILIYKNLADKYTSLSEFQEKNPGDIYYVTDPSQQAQYVSLFKQQGLDALVLPTLIDNHFVQFLEHKLENVKFKRIDSHLSESLGSEGGADMDKVVGIFKEYFTDPNLTIEAKILKSDDLSALMLQSEESRRMKEMGQMYGGMDMSHMFPDKYTLVLNLNNELIKKLDDIQGDERGLVCKHVYDLAVLANKPLDSDNMLEFIKRSNQLLIKYTAAQRNCP